MTELEKRRAIIDHCLKLNRTGLNHGTSGNISVRHEDGMLISPTSTPYDALTPECIAFVGRDGTASGPKAPSSEWHFHLGIYASDKMASAVVHAHPTYATALAIQNREIPPVHYMIAIFGGTNVRVAPYAIYGSEALSANVVAALKDRSGALMANHGAVTTGAAVEQAFWRMEELEALSAQYHAALLLGDPPELSGSDMADVLAKIATYGRGDG